MNRYRILLTAGALLSRAAMGQTPAPARPVPPALPAVPAPAPRPAPLPFRELGDDLDVQIDAETIRAQVEAAIDRDAIRERVRAQVEAIRPQIESLKEMAKVKPGVLGIEAPFVFAPQTALRHHTSGDRAYDRGQRALDGRRWDEALEAFTQVASANGSRADGALYWKAYALTKLGRRDDALAALAELRKSYPSSRWLEDAKALELEVKQASGQKVSPEAENDEDLKLMALNGLVQSDPERALPLLENLLKTSNSPKLKERVLFVMAQSDSSRGKQLLEQVARGSAGNPDLQLRAISYISATSKKTDNRQLLWNIYTSSNDLEVKRAILHGLLVSRDNDHLLQIAKTEKDPKLRLDAISLLGAGGGQGELWQIYQGETSPDVKQQILRSMAASRSFDRLMEIAKTEKDVKLRRAAIQALGSEHEAKTGDALVSIYASETDPGVKRSIVEGLREQRNAKALVDLARKENDPAMKREIVSRLSNMKSKEAADYLMELLK